VAQRLRQRALRITFGKAIVTDCLNCQSLLKWQFAMYRGANPGYKEFNYIGLLNPETPKLELL
jgi:hypothetical protein